MCLEPNVFVEIYCSCLYFCTTLLLLEPHARQLLLPTILRFGPSDGTVHLAWAVTGEADRADGWRSDGCRCRRGRSSALGQTLFLAYFDNFKEPTTRALSQFRPQLSQLAAGAWGRWKLLKIQDRAPDQINQRLNSFRRILETQIARSGIYRYCQAGMLLITMPFLPSKHIGSFLFVEVAFP
jgi:hypothetical protein